MSKIQAKECQNVEYKQSWKDEYLKWICNQRGRFFIITRTLTSELAQEQIPVP